MTNNTKRLISKRLVQAWIGIMGVYALICVALAIPAVAENVEFLIGAKREIVLFIGIVWGVLTLVFLFINHFIGVPISNLKQTLKVFSYSFDITIVLSAMYLIQPKFQKVYDILFFLIWILIALIAAAVHCEGLPEDKA